MTDAEKLQRAMAGEYVGDVSRLAPVLVAEIERLRAERDRLRRDRSRLIDYIDGREPVTRQEIEDWLDEREAIEGEKGGAK